MYIKNIKIKDFRNYDELELEFNNKVNFILGQNAQGKTNLLESLYITSIGKSFRTGRDSEMIGFDKDFAKIYAEISRDGLDGSVEIIIDRSGKKFVKLDGVKIRKASELLKNVYIVIFSPEDLKIVKDEPERRRKFIDREMCQIRAGYLSDLSDYKRVLKQRNAYLKGENIDMDMLSIWDVQLASLGTRIIERRRSFIEKLEEISREIHYKITGGKERLQLKYEPCEFDPDKVREDIRNRTTGHGPHRDDFSIIADGIDLRKFGSQGQQRTAALSLKLSEIKIIEEEKREKPILLLDDVLSELDNDRQVYLLNSLGENQMFITTTDIIGSVAKNLPEGKIFKINNGQVEIEI